MVEHSIPLDILDDLSSRFIINVPDEERKDLVRMCFQIELAHWFYLDFYCTDNNTRKLKSCSMKEFTMHIFQHIPFLRVHISRVDTILDQWREYKQNVPTFGAILLNEDMTRVLLVQNYWAKNSWGFPKGKVNEDEDPSHCAVREVFEETGFDISNLINNDQFIESIINDRLVRLYIITGVQRNIKFEPQTRKEIKNVEWFALADLPNTAKDMTPKVKMGVGPNAFFMVVPFIRRVKRWISEKRQREKQLPTRKRHRHKSLGDVDTVIKGNKHHQQLQTVQNNTIDGTKVRQLNTSPIQNRRTLECKNLSKAGFKRNLFGDSSNEKYTKSPNTVLAKQLINSPGRITSGSKKKLTQQTNENKTVECNNNTKEHSMWYDNAVEKLYPNISKISRDIFNFQSETWSHFKFDKQAILNCI
ncbi:hypothetical protein PV325_003116 [Microctonus aethiopoides]|nr:hypothetical protein PV325_003116 [Microctonus aethiopoides]